MTGLHPKTIERIGSLKALADEGLTRKEASIRLGISEQRMVLLVKLAGGVKFRKGNIKVNNERADDMAELYRRGRTLQQIGDHYGITRERVRQLISRYHNLTCKDGGQHVDAARREAERRAAKEKKWLGAYGCTVAQWRELKRLRKPLKAFREQRKNAQHRQIGWELNLWQWWTIWQESGHWAERGRGQGYAMCRRGDTGPYAAWNVFIAPCFINSREQPKHSHVDLPIGVRRLRRGFGVTRQINGVRIKAGPFPTVSQAAAAYWAAS